MSLFLKNKCSSLPLSEKKLLENMATVLDVENCQEDLSIALVDNQEMIELHQKFLGKNTITDVLSFPLGEKNEEDQLLGEVVVSVEKAQEEAKKHQVDWEIELMLYLIHGFLHLVGYDDKEEVKAESMHQREDYLLNILGYSTENL